MKKIRVFLILLSRFAFWFHFCTLSESREISLKYVDTEYRPVLIYGDKTLAEVVYDESGEMIHCRLHQLQEESDADHIIKDSGLPAKYKNLKEMVLLVNKCSQLEKPRVNSTKTTSTIDLSILNSNALVKLILRGLTPGTKWCGTGDTADSFEDLGREIELDACCRAHDHCPAYLNAFNSAYGLINFVSYAKLLCDCDKEFYSCLKNTNTRYADAVGSVYFNIVPVECIKENKTSICAKNRTESDGRQQCVKWVEDPNSTKMIMTKLNLKY